MDVVRIETEHGNHIEPPHDPEWDLLTSLRWKAAVVALDCPGLKIEVHPCGRDFSLVVGESSTSYRHGDAWLYLNGVATGWREARRG